MRWVFLVALLAGCASPGAGVSFDVSFTEDHAGVHVDAALHNHGGEPIWMAQRSCELGIIAAVLNSTGDPVWAPSDPHLHCGVMSEEARRLDPGETHEVSFTWDHTTWDTSDQSGSRPAPAGFYTVEVRGEFDGQTELRTRPVHVP